MAFVFLLTIGIQTVGTAHRRTMHGLQDKYTNTRASGQIHIKKKKKKKKMHATPFKGRRRKKEVVTDVSNRLTSSEHNGYPTSCVITMETGQSFIKDITI